MISYHVGYLGVSPSLLFSLTGSAIPRALLWSVPCGLAGIGLFLFWQHVDREATASVAQCWSGYTFVLGFMICLRMQHAYQRFWEAATLTHECRAEWLHAVGCVIAFSSDDAAVAEEVKHFHHLLARLASMLHEAALERLCLAHEPMDLGGLEHLESSAVEYLNERQHCRGEIVCQWILRLIYDAMKRKLVDAPPPIFGPVIKEIVQGMVKLNNVEKIVQLPVPFPYVQMTVVLLLFHWMITPIIAALIMPNWRWAGGVAFSSVFFLWSIYFISMEVEMPFGHHSNGLPSDRMHSQLNECLKTLLHQQTQTPPGFIYRTENRCSYRNSIASKRTALTDSTRSSISLHALCSSPSRRSESPTPEASV